MRHHVPVEYPWPTAAADGAAVRHAVRVLLVDAEDRLLLFRYIADDGEQFWCPAGGGIEPGESPEAAAHREVFEETGWSPPLELTEIWHRRQVAVFLGRLIDQRERWFLTRVPVFAVDNAGFSELEQRTISTWRWWDVDALEGASERLVPGDLAARLHRLMIAGPPSRPVVIGA